MKRPSVEEETAERDTTLGMSGSLRKAVPVEFVRRAWVLAGGSRRGVEASSCERERQEVEETPRTSTPGQLKARGVSSYYSPPAASSVTV